jgi:hypothetical protein
MSVTAGDENNSNLLAQQIKMYFAHTSIRVDA